MSAPVERPVKFSDRWDALMAEVILRNGFIGRQSYGSWTIDRRSAETYGVKVVKKDWVERVDYSKGKCPMCQSSLSVTHVREETEWVWQGTFAEDERREFAAGTLICSADITHVHETMHLDSTLAEAVHFVDIVAEEWGW